MNEQTQTTPLKTTLDVRTVAPMHRHLSLIHI